MTGGFVQHLRDAGVTVDDELRLWPIKWVHERMAVNADAELIERLRGVLRAGEDTEPLVLCRECFAVADGSHRLRAYFAEGRSLVPVRFADCHEYANGYFCQLGKAPGMEYVQAWSHMPCVSTVYHRADLDYPFFAKTYSDLAQGPVTATRLWERARAAIFGVGWPASQKVLDVGSRESTLPRYLVERGATVTALDLDTSAILPGEHITPVQGDVRQLEFPDNTFDAVTCVSCVNLIPGDGDTQAAREMVRVVKPGQRVAITVQFWTEYREYPSPETGRRVYTKEAIYERLVNPIADICGPVDFDRTDWSYWPYKQECKAITDTGMNLQVAIVVLRKD